MAAMTSSCAQPGRGQASPTQGPLPACSKPWFLISGPMQASSPSSCRSSAPCWALSVSKPALLCSAPLRCTVAAADELHVQARWALDPQCGPPTLAAVGPAVLRMACPVSAAAGGELSSSTSTRGSADLPAQPDLASRVTWQPACTWPALTMVCACVQTFTYPGLLWILLKKPPRWGWHWTLSILCAIYGGPPCLGQRAGRADVLRCITGSTAVPLSGLAA